MTYPVTGGSLTFDTSSKKITKCDAGVTVADIPAEIDGVQVLGIDSHAFKSCLNLTSVTIPAGVSKISGNLFTLCSKLAVINVSGDNPYYSSLDGVLFDKLRSHLLAYPRGREQTEYIIHSGVTVIEDDAFSNCSKLTSITLPFGAQEIGNYAFSGCWSLKSLNIYEKVTSIGTRAFQNCDQLTEAVFYDGSQDLTVGRYLFSGCSSLTSVTLPKNITSIGASPFYGCDSLTRIDVADGNTHYMDIDGVLVDRQTGTLLAYPLGRAAGGRYTVPSGVTRIGEAAFYDCRLTGVTIPYGVTSIGQSAFSSCASLAEITIPGSVTSMETNAFWKCSALKKVTIPKVTVLAPGVFSDCMSLTSVTIPDSVTSIGDSAFSYCKSLREVEIPDSVTSIGSTAFYLCEKLAKVTFSHRVTSIGQNAFSTTGLTDVYFHGSDEQWAEITIGKWNDPLLNATRHYKFEFPKAADPEWVYVQKLTKNSLAAADALTRDMVNLAIYNLIFKAYYCPNRVGPTMREKIKGTPKLHGKESVMSTWPLQNNWKTLQKQNGGKINTDLAKMVYDRNLCKSPSDPIEFSTAAWGCDSYAHFASAYIYGTSGNKVMCTDKSAGGIKEFFHKCLDPGEHIRYENNEAEKYHSLVFLGEDDAGEGFYCLSYSGGVAKDGTLSDTGHCLWITYKSYKKFANDMKNYKKVFIFDTNGKDKKAGGSYYDGTAKPVTDVRVANNIEKYVVLVACPVKAVVRYGDETLDSSVLTSEGQVVSASFGTLTRDADNRLRFELDPNIDYDLEITGTGEGNMDLTLEYHGENVPAESRKFIGYPITASTSIQTSGFDPLAGFVLYEEKENGDLVVWGAGIDETVTAETATENAGLYSSDNNVPEYDLYLDVVSAGDRSYQIGIHSPFDASGEAAYGYAVAALYDSTGRLRETALQKIESGNPNDLYTLRFRSAAAETDSVKVLLLDRSYRPLREAEVCTLLANDA